MTREEYISLREQNHIGNIVYDLYVSECNRRGQQYINPNEFMLMFNMWEHAHECVERVLQHYDMKFEIITISFKGKVVKFI